MFDAVKSVAQVPLFVSVEQLLPETALPATFVIATVPALKVFEALVVCALNVAKVLLPPTAAARPPTMVRVARMRFMVFNTFLLWRSQCGAVYGAAWGRVVTGTSGV